MMIRGKKTIRYFELFFPIFLYFELNYHRLFLILMLIDFISKKPSFFFYQDKKLNMSLQSKRKQTKELENKTISIRVIEIRKFS